MNTLTLEELMSAPWKHFGSIDSTNMFLLRYNRDDITNGTICTADVQTKGMGRNGRTWYSPMGGLYFSALFLSDSEFKYLHLLNFVAAFAAAEAVESLFPDVSIRLKWPNDLIIHQKKVGGILLQGITAKKARIVVGIGINVYNDISALPDRSHFPATLLGDESVYRPSVMELAGACREHLFRAYLNWIREPTSILEQFQDRSATFGKRISFFTGDHTIYGIDMGIGRQGEIIIRTPDMVLSFLTGEIKYIE